MKKNRSCTKYNKISLLLLLLLAGLSVLLSGCGSGKDEESSGKAKVDDLKSFNAYTLKGNLFTNEMFADYDATIIYYWAPWSDVSLYELKNIGALAKRLPDNIYVSTVCFDSETGKPKTILEDYDMGQVRTFSGGDGDFAKVSEEIANIPTTIMVNNKGKVIAGPIVGVQDDFEEVYLKELNRALRKAGKDQIELKGTDEEEESKDKTEEVDQSKKKVKTTESSKEKKKESTDSEDEESSDSYDEGSDESYDEGSDEGSDESYDEGSDESYDEGSDESYDEE